MRRAALIAGVLALLGAAGLYLFRPSAGPVADDATVGGEPGATPPPPNLQTAATPSLEARASRSPLAAGGARGGEESVADDAEPIGAGPADDPVVCRLTFVGDGPRPSKVDVHVQAGNGSGYIERRATADTWEVRIPRLPEYVVAVVLDGWASDQRFHDVKPTSDDRLELEVRLPNRPSFVVVDEATGAALPEGAAREATGDDSFLDERPAPGPTSLAGTAIRADGTGTILLPKTALGSVWWVGAPAHAWARVRVSPDDVGRRVALFPGGALRVEIEGVPEGEEEMVGATPAEAADQATRQALLTRDADTGRHTVEGLLPGRWVVTVGRKTDLWVREPWATAEAEVVAGRTTDVRLVVPPRDTMAPRTVEFELVVPAGWKGMPDSIRVQGCGDATESIERLLEVPEDASLPWRVGVEALKNGPYQVVVAPYLWSSLVRVRRDTTVIRVEVPPPAVVRIRVLDARDGKPLSGVRVAVTALDPWSTVDREDALLDDPPGPVADEDAEATSWLSAGTALSAGKEAGSYEGQVFAGAVMVGADLEGYVPVDERVVIPASATVFEHVIRLSRGGTIEVRIVGAGKLLDAPEGSLTLTQKREDGDEQTSWGQRTSADKGSATFHGVPAGTYVLMWRRTKGRAPVTKEVTLRVGETVKVEFEAPPPPK